MSFNNIPAELRASDCQSGIYMILNWYDGKYYFGQAVNFQRRYKSHFGALKANNHRNRHLQNAWNKYSFWFEFIIVEEVNDLSNLTEIEQLWLNASDCCNPEKGYNLSPTAESSLGIKLSEEAKESHRKKIFTESHRANMAIAQTGRKHSDKTKIQMSWANFGKPKSEEHKIKNGLVHQHFDKWPHKGGRRCTCRECKNKKNEYNKINGHKWKKSNG